MNWLNFAETFPPQIDVSIGKKLSNRSIAILRPKKTLISFHNKQVYIYGHRHFHVNKTLPTLGNTEEQQQIKFYEKLSGKLIFSLATKILKMFYFTRLTRQVLKQ